jgi:23S rRNA (uracil1939-C5)-methyltransferase
VESDTTLIEVERIAGGGDGVGREDSGRVVFVPRTAPGDVVRVKIVQAKSHWARGRVQRYVRRGTGRRAVPCPMYDECGGCRLQHLTPWEQRRAKRDVVQEALRRIGGLATPVPDLVAGRNEFGYRNRVTFSLSTKAGEVLAGYRRIDNPAAVADIPECLLGEVPIQSAWRALREVWAQGICDPPGGPDTQLTIRTANNGAVDLLVRGGEALAPEALRTLMEWVPGMVGCHYARSGSAPRCLVGAETLRDRWQDIEFDLPADVFLQVNRKVSAAMDRWLEERVGDMNGSRVLDLYSGVGARAIRWATRGAQVTACEVSRRAVAACRQAASSAGARLAIEAKRVESRIDDLLPADLVVVNPPRAGLSRHVAEALVSGSAGRLAYVSCDPATLARDLGRLQTAWNLMEVQPFDAFPQTAHVETIAWLHRR